MKKILIVDDEPNIVMALEYTFKKNNFEVFIARDGKEALEILEKQLPDVIILDVMMPMVDGYATIEEIKKDEQSIKLLKNPNQIEKYAREKYYMKKDSEDIYIIEFEEQRIKDSLLEAQQ